MKRQITDIAGNEIVQALPKVKDVMPVGTQILVELLTPEEIMGPTKLHIPEGASKNAINGAPQGYILKIGPKVDENWGFKVGQRVVMSGGYVPLPESTSPNGRPRACVEPHIVKAVLIEE